MHVSMIYLWCGWNFVTNGRTNECLILIHACMMHKAMILALDPEACMYAWCTDVWCTMHKYTWPWCIYVWCMMNTFIHDPDTCMYDVYIFGLRPLTLMHVCVMHTSIIFDPDTCVYDACIYDATYLSYMDKPWPWCIYTLCMYAWCIYICSLIIMHMCLMH